LSLPLLRFRERGNVAGIGIPGTYAKAEPNAGVLPTTSSYSAPMGRAK
jgi:hypothetical protein